jgi:hypothetical protein
VAGTRPNADDALRDVIKGTIDAGDLLRASASWQC